MDFMSFASVHYHIVPTMNIKTCSLSVPVSLHVCKENKISTVENTFCLHNFKITGVCTNFNENKTNDTSGWKQKKSVIE